MELIFFHWTDCNLLATVSASVWPTVSITWMGGYTFMVNSFVIQTFRSTPSDNPNCHSHLLESAKFFHITKFGYARSHRYIIYTSLQWMVGLCKHRSMHSYSMDMRLAWDKQEGTFHLGSNFMDVCPCRHSYGICFSYAMLGDHQIHSFGKVL